MKAEKGKTINYIKERREVPEKAKELRKIYAAKRKLILKALEEEGKTIPEIAKATGLPLHETTYYLMSLRKFGDVVTGEIDDMDEYFYYELKKS